MDKEQVRIERIEGRGPRILLLPGLGARGEGFRALADELAECAQPILVEYPEGRHAGVGARALAKQVLDASGPVDAVVASSMGGLVAAHLAGRGAVRGVAFVGSFSALDHLGPRAPLFRLMAPIARYGRPGWMAASIAAWRHVPNHRVHEVVPTTAIERSSVWHRALAVSKDERPPRLDELDLPFVALHGSRDPLVPVSVLERLGQALPPGTPLHVLEGAGHVPYWTHPAEVGALLKPWVSAVERMTSVPREAAMMSSG